MIEKLKLEPYIPESLVVHIYEKDGTLVAERYDTICYVEDSFVNVKCAQGMDCFVDAKLFCTFAQSLAAVKLADDGSTKVQLILFNKAKYELDMVKAVSIPKFKFPELKNKTTFDFGGVENATSKSQLQKELNMVYVDEEGCAASDSIVAGVSTKFKSKTAFTVPESIQSMVSKDEVEWGIDDGKLYISFGVYKIVATLTPLPDFAWWEASRAAFNELPEFIPCEGLKSAVQRLANFSQMVYFKDGRLAADKHHWEPVSIDGSGEIFDVSNLLSVVSDDKIGVALSEGNLYVKTDESLFVCCSIDANKPEVEEDFEE